MKKIEVPNGYYTVNEFNQYNSFDDEPAIVIRTHDEINIEDNYITVYGYKAWYKNGQIHREGKPAIIHDDGREFYYIDGNIQNNE
jgi:hypothetical protein